MVRFDALAGMDPSGLGHEHRTKNPQLDVLLGSNVRSPRSSWASFERVAKNVIKLAGSPRRLPGIEQLATCS